jgi:hypothetical protein
MAKMTKEQAEKFVKATKEKQAGLEKNVAATKKKIETAKDVIKELDKAKKELEALPE